MYKLKDLLIPQSTNKKPINELIGTFIGLMVLVGLTKIVVARGLLKWLRKRISAGMYKQHSGKALKVMEKVLEKAAEGKIKADTKIGGRPARDYFTKSSGLKDKFVEIINKKSTSKETAMAYKSGRGAVVSEYKGMQKSVKDYWYTKMSENPANYGKLDIMWENIVNTRLFGREWNFASPGSSNIARDEFEILQDLWKRETNPVKTWYYNYRSTSKYSYINLMHTNESLAMYLIEKENNDILDFMHKNFKRNRDDFSSFVNVKIFDSDAKGSYRWQAAQGKP